MTTELEREHADAAIRSQSIDDFTSEVLISFLDKSARTKLVFDS